MNFLSKLIPSFMNWNRADLKNQHPLPPNIKIPKNLNLKELNSSAQKPSKNLKHKDIFQIQDKLDNQTFSNIVSIGKILFVSAVVLGASAALWSFGTSMPFSKKTSEPYASSSKSIGLSRYTSNSLPALWNLPEHQIQDSMRLPNNLFKSREPLVFKYDEHSKYISLTEKQLQRIEDVHLIEKQISNYVSKFEPKYQEMKRTMLMLIELQRDLTDSYYVFSHGMSQTQAKITRFISDLDHRLWPVRDSKDFIFSRVVPPYKIGTPLQKILNQMDSKDDHDLRSELLSADAKLLNTEYSESAFYFYFINSNIFDDMTWIICDILGKFSQEFAMKFSEIDCKDKITFKAEKKLKENGVSNLGALLIYAIPKEIIDNPETNFVYVSKHFGKVPDKDNPLARLEILIKEPAEENLRKNGNTVRILTSHLKPENGIKSFMIGESNDATDSYKLQNMVLLKIAHNFFHEVVNHCQTSEWSKNPFITSSKKTNTECERLIRELVPPIGARSLS